MNSVTGLVYNTGRRRNHLWLPPQDTTLVTNSQETLHDSTSTPTPVASVPQTLVENNQLVVEDCLHEAQLSLALESNGSKSPTKAQAPVQARNEKLRVKKVGSMINTVTHPE
ncbi:hypothetical protein L1987_45461 [Smallanthus sonchifolius]|uniref:Uncharacterized protein n=1 Tax=Smallanthus sonchifolius TaxID=185202 RepID=A0ACB9FY23_9ASTR|nr:hypothetical protein L1987_45461 [Smallanthus sonchifolius]